MHGYFENITFLAGEYLPDCRAQVGNSCFPDSYHLQLLQSGEVYFCRDDGPEATLSRPAVYWHLPSHSYSYGSTGKLPWHHYWFSVRGPRAQAIFMQALAPLARDGFCYVFRVSEYQVLFRDIIDRIPVQSYAAQAEATAMLEKLVALLCSESEHDGSRRSPAVHDVAEMIRHKPCATYDFHAIAADYHISYSHFRRQFRNHTSHAPHDFVLLCRMQLAATEIARSSGPIKKIAGDMGYEDSSQFSKVFKSKIGVSPQRYRDLLPLPSVET